jgi:hypothetical protein
MGMKYIYAIPLLLLSCTPKNSEPVHDENEVTVKTQNYSLDDAKNNETLYSLSDGQCRISWQTIAKKKDQTIEVQLRNRSECKRPFAQVTQLHDQVIDRILKDHSPTTFKSLTTNGLKSLQPDGSWNVVIANAARASSEYQDYRKNYPKHASGKSLNQIFVELARQTEPYSEFKQMLASHGLNFELSEVEKVFNSKNEHGETVIDDAGSFWWRPIAK